MIKVYFLGPIELEPMEIEATNIKELREELNKMESLKSWLPLCAIALNDKIITDVNTIFQDNDKISLLPPVCGG